MNRALGHMNWTIVLVYLDAIVYGISFEDRIRAFYDT